MAYVRLANYQQKLTRGYNGNVKPREFEAGDLVLGKAVENMKDQNARMFALN